MLDETEIRNLIGREVLDSHGKSVGYVERAFNDRDSGKPEWIGVFTGTFRHRHLLVPIQGAKNEGVAVRIPWTKEQVHGAPDYGTANVISEEMEREAYRHFGLEPALTR
jgi:sporulation protein YlmC with PRC-barrel domain